MAALAWSMTALGYPAHRRSRSPMMGFTHMSTHAVLQVADHLGLGSGWLHAEGSQPQLERLSLSAPLRVAVGELIADRRVAMTDGLASGSLIFVAVTGGETPPGDRSLAVWADERGLPWVEVVDNEIAYWGGLTDAQTDRLLAWFLAQRPLDVDWRQVGFAPGCAARLRAVLFAHGWLRNTGLASPGRTPSLDLWAGVQERCQLEHAGSLPPSRVGSGLRLSLSDGLWSAKELTSRCPLADDTGRLAR